MSRPQKTLREALEALLFASDDGNEYEHNDGCDGEPDCAACWVETIRGVLADHPIVAPAAPPAEASLRLTHDVYKPYDVVRNWHDDNHTGRLEGCQEQPCHAVAKLGDK